MRKAQQGFTLIELMIVIAIIAIIAAIAIPNLLESKKLSNERSVTATLKQLHTAQQMFKEKLEKDLDNGLGNPGDKDGEYAAGFDELEVGPTSGKQLLNMIHDSMDATLSEKNGYMFRLFTPGTVNGDESSWCCGAWPKTFDKTGNKAFCVTEEGIMFESDNNSAAPGVTPLVPYFDGTTSEIALTSDIYGTDWDNSTISGTNEFAPIK